MLTGAAEGKPGKAGSPAGVVGTRNTGIVLGETIDSRPSAAIT